jgi:hypothetical protein
MSTTADIDNIVRQAQAAAEAMIAPARPANPSSLTSLPNSSMLVDHRLKVSEFGLLIDNNQALFDTIEVVIDMTAVQACYCIKYGNPLIYKKTYDRVLEAGGEPWSETIAKAQMINPNVRQYPSADIPMVLVRTLKDKKGAVVAQAGKVLGHSLSTTNWRPFEKFVRTLIDQGLSTARVRATLGAEPMTNARGNRWGVMTFELLGAAR